MSVRRVALVLLLFVPLLAAQQTGAAERSIRKEDMKADVYFLATT